MKKALVIRPGAYGDVLIVSPVFHALKDLGYRTYAYVGKRGEQILRHNPYVDEVIIYEKEGTENPKIADDFKNVENEVNPDWCKNFSESVEVNLALHPRSPAYIYPKNERRKRCDKNYYDEAERWAGIDLHRHGKILPEMYFTDEELNESKQYLKDGINIVWCLSGSGSNKAYPWIDYVMGEVLTKYEDVNFITIGDERCQMIESLKDERITNLSGNLSFRVTAALTRSASLVVSPDTGALHVAGCTQVPKIGILGHSTINNITKYFANDYTLEADSNLCQCSPCFYLIYDHKVQCPVDPLSGAAWCMSHGQQSERLFNQIEKVINEKCRRKDSDKEVSSML